MYLLLYYTYIIKLSTIYIYFFQIHVYKLVQQQLQVGVVGVNGLHVVYHVELELDTDIEFVSLELIT